MELLEGETLRELIASRSLDVATAVALAIQVADAVDAADGKGIIHRDIKPANIFVTATLVDLGLNIELTIETGFLYIGSATRTDTACTGLERPKPGQTDIEMIGTVSVAPTIQRLPTSASGSGGRLRPIGTSARGNRWKGSASRRSGLENRGEQRISE
jgi:serine/threonine protein kinase